MLECRDEPLLRETRELLPKYAWYQDNAGERGCPVGGLKPNDLGLFDMEGNAIQWCHDMVDIPPGSLLGGVVEDTSDETPVVNSKNRILRGAAFFTSAHVCSLRQSKHPIPGCHVARHWLPRGEDNRPSPGRSGAREFVGTQQRDRLLALTEDPRGWLGAEIPRRPDEGSENVPMRTTARICSSKRSTSQKPVGVGQLTFSSLQTTSLAPYRLSGSTIELTASSTPS